MRSLSLPRLTVPLLALQVDQALFVPATVMATLVFNMLTGILLWEDWKVIHQWIAYVMVRARARLEFAPTRFDPGGAARARAQRPAPPTPLLLITRSPPSRLRRCT